MTKQDQQYSRVARRQQAAHKQKHSQQPKKKWSFKKIAVTVALSLVALIFVGFIGGSLLFFAYAKSAPALTTSKLTSDSSTTIYDAKGHKILTLGTEKRQAIKEQKVPQQLKDAIVSIEDKRFYKHHGVDPYRIMSAAVNDVTGSSSLQGGSTLDQQLIKLAYFSTKKSDQTLKRKAQEAWLAIKMDKQYSKDQILTFYINKVFMGNGIYGMQTAAEYYYGKHLSELSLAQTALIAGIPNAPSSYNPYSNVQLATQRRNEVLNAMVANKKISAAQAAQAKAVSVTDGLVSQDAHTNSSQTKQAKWSDAYLKQVIKDLYDKGYDPYASSLKVYTNLNLDIQKRLYDMANTNEYVYYPDNKVQIAATIINPNNGKVLAMLGGRKNGDVTYGLNRAVQTSRTNGSTAKPLMDFGPAIEYLSWATYHQLEDTEYNYPGTSIALHDFDKAYKGTMTMQDALMQSRNIPAIRALATVGLTRARNFVNKLGFNYKSVEYSNGIGMPSSTLQNAAAYAAFDNGGTYYEPSYINKVTIADGESKTYESSGKQVMQASTAYMITYMLQQVITNPSGTGYRANIPGFYQAGKTGTNAYPDDIETNFPDNATMDSWFNAYTKHYSVSIWMGYDHPYRDANYLDTATARIPIAFYKSLIANISQGKSNTNWKRPSNVYTKTLDGQKYLYLAGTSDPYTSQKKHSNSSTHSSNSVANSQDTSSISSLTTTSSVLSSSSSSSSSQSTAESSSSSTASANTNSSQSQTPSQPSNPTSSAATTTTTTNPNQ
ncbi:transglycosylase domain-containing protein [Ligilactobacillus agilis]|uniref:transglycosylase domain-containing protein n=1 Tax=Ligilactobacillus agilis TaxID=1601 RepID=UPI00186897E7|nr:transglycosylase domain-containing protein [Ligilactobacillus agilis]